MRTAQINRDTKETQIKLEINLDGTGVRKIHTGVGFFDHMLELFACHSNCDLTLECKGDLNVDAHHTVEDVGIVLGKAIAEALGDKRGIARYSSVFLPMDESLAGVVLDVSGRAFLVFKAEFCGMIGDFDGQLVEEFFRAVCTNAGLTLHINLLYGQNSHHKAEAIFKGFARALRDAVKIVSDEIPSSKGVI